MTSTGAQPVFTCAEIIAATEGTWVNPSDAIPTISGPLSTDTRTLAAGQWFIPIVGERFNGHDFLQQAIQAKVAGCLVQAGQIHNLASLTNGHIPIIEVADTTLAYLAIAGWYRKQRCAGTVVVGVTGSSGKTTVKEMLVAALSPYCTVQATAKNFNNDIGVAQTLLGCQPSTDVLIVEMGMRGLGEIERLSVAVQPSVAVITTVGSAHIGRLGSKAAIAQAKAEIMAGLVPHAAVPSSPVAIYPSNATLLTPWVAALPATIQRHPFTVVAGPVQSPVAGAHMQGNANAVALVGQALGLSPQQIQAGLNTYVVPEGRGNLITLCTSPHHTLISDAYNANPESMAASLHHFFATYATGHQVAVLAGMKELGDFTDSAHQQVGALWQQLALGATVPPALWLIGDEFKSTAAAVSAAGLPCQWLASIPSAPTAMVPLIDAMVQALPLQAEGAVLLKGSRAYGLDALGEALVLHYAKQVTAV